MEFVKSKYVTRTFLPKLEDYYEKGNFIQQRATYCKELRVFGNVEFRAGKDLKDSFILLFGGWNGKKELWAAELLLLIGAKVGRDKIGGEFSFIQ